MATKEGAKTNEVKGETKASESTAGLVKVRKGDEVLEVHPNALAEHTKLGWKAE